MRVCAFVSERVCAVSPGGMGTHLAVIWLYSWLSLGHTHRKEPSTFSQVASPHTPASSTHSFTSAHRADSPSQLLHHRHHHHNNHIHHKCYHHYHHHHRYHYHHHHCRHHHLCHHYLGRHHHIIITVVFIIHHTSLSSSSSSSSAVAPNATSLARTTHLYKGIPVEDLLVIHTLGLEKCLSAALEKWSWK